MNKKRFTVVISFADHLKGIGQYQTETPEEALEMFVQSNELIEGYDRDRLMKAINPLTHAADIQGFWLASFSEPNIGGEDNNPVLGGHIIQTDPDAPTRK